MRVAELRKRRLATATLLDSHMRHVAHRSYHPNIASVTTYDF